MKVFALIAAAACLSAAASAQQFTRISQFSGKPVPRYESLRYDAANGRVGPGQDHAIRWTYERRGLPVLVLKESNDWRRVRDPDGDEVWMHARMLSDTTTALLIKDTDLKDAPEADAKATALMTKGVIVELGACGPEWCQISIGGKSGYTARTAIWGAPEADGL